MSSGEMIVLAAVVGPIAVVVEGLLVWGAILDGRGQARQPRVRAVRGQMRDRMVTPGISTQVSGYHSRPRIVRMPGQ
jgi:hypothetical protein